jgi:hypothetical protein
VNGEWGRFWCEMLFGVLDPYLNSQYSMLNAQFSSEPPIVEAP